jgi:hypothetical protein
MKVTIKGKTTNFDVDTMCKLSLDEFNKFCLGLSTFKQLSPKERKASIKKAYGNIKGDVKKVKGVKSVQDLSRGNKRGD